MTEKFDDYFEYLDEKENCTLVKLMGTNIYCILRPIENIKNLLNTTNMMKPSFSYYKSLESIKQEGKSDARVEPFPEQSIIAYDEDDNLLDNEILILEEELELERIKIIFNAIVSYDNANSLYEIVSDLENIFGLIYKFAKKKEQELISSLIFIKYYEKYIKELQEGWNLRLNSNPDEDNNDDFIFENKDSEIIKVNINSSFSTIKDFDVDNDKIRKKEKQYIIAMRLYMDPEGISIIDLIDWYLNNDNRKLEFESFLKIIREHCDERVVKYYNPDNVEIKIIDADNIPKIEIYPDEIYGINFKTNLMNLESVEIEQFIQKIS